VDAIFHLGACSATTERDADYLFENTSQHPHLVRVEPASRVRSSMPPARHYGDGQGNSIARRSRLRPLNMYGFSSTCSTCGAEHRYSTASPASNTSRVRSYESHKGDMRSMVHKLRQISRQGGAALQSTARLCDGEQMRDFVYVKDAWRHALFLEHREIGGCSTARRPGADLKDLMNAVSGDAGDAAD